MRPTIGEQLAGTCRVLEDVVAPAVVGDQALDALHGLVRNLRMLESSWSGILPFLHWDNIETAALLRAAAPELPQPLARRIDAGCGAPALGPTGTTGGLFDVEGVQERNDRLRGLLSEVIAVLDTAGPLYRTVVAHLRERTRRYPMRLVPELPRDGASATATTEA